MKKYSLQGMLDTLTKDLEEYQQIRKATTEAHIQALRELDNGLARLVKSQDREARKLNN